MDVPIDALILELAPVLVLNPDHKIEKWNKGLEQLYGWSQAEALGQQAEQLLMTVFPQPRPEIERRLLEQGQWQGELVQTRKDGRRIVVGCRWLTQKDEGGQVQAVLQFLSEQQHSGESLHTSLQKLELLFDVLPVGLSVLDKDGRLIKSNRTMEKTLGMRNEDLRKGNYNPPGYLRADGSPMPTAELPGRRVLRGEQEVLSQELGLIKGDGELIWVSVDASACRFEDWRAVVVTSDITRRKGAEDALQAAQKRTESILESVGDSHIILDRDWRYVYANNAALTEIGRRREQILGRSLWELYPDIIGTELEKYYRTAMEERLPVSFDFHYQTKDAWWQNRFYPAPEGLAVFGSNITRRKQAEEKYREAELFTQATLDALADHICVLDDKGTVISTNRAWREFADANGAHDPDYFVGVNYLAVCNAARGEDSAAAAAFAEGLRKVMLHETNQFSLEYACDSPEEERWFLASVTHFTGEDRHRLVISHRNISGRKKAEEGLRESRERLSRLSYHLVQTQEQERRRIARELHDEIGQTLTALTISLNGITQSSLDSACKQKFEAVKGLTGDLIDQVSALSSELRPRVLDDLGLVPGLISMINRLSQQTGIEIDFKHGPLDQKQIPAEIEITAYRIIQEALTNIVRHAGTGLAVVRIQIDENTLWIQVQDEGNGFDYYSALNSGESIGLMGMLERSEQTGGIFTIQTAPGEGTNITCRLPLAGQLIERREYGRD
ncbi:MAG: PAS domain-containing protein [Anaerolineaceae bacterium]|nr:PAS domain-containing protein [Anaerolineaceae bacterium]